MFQNFAKAVEVQVASMVALGMLFRVNATKEELWEKYLDSFPEGTNPIHKERREYDCNHCKSFIRQMAGVVCIKDGALVSVWDVKADGYYQIVADTMSAFVKSRLILEPFIPTESKIGVAVNHAPNADGSVSTYHHFSTVLPKNLVNREAPSKIGEFMGTKQVFERGLEELTLDSLEVALELINQNSLYRGEEFKGSLVEFLKLKKEYLKLTTPSEKSLFIWQNFTNRSARIRNTAFGTLLQDLSEGKELDNAVSAYEKVVAPANYKRPTALVTQKMIDNAMKTINELGIEPSLYRRYAKIDDVKVSDVLFVDRKAKPLMKGGVAELLSASVPQGTPKLSKVEEVDIEDFLQNILPKVESVELLVENKHSKNLMSLVAPVNAEAPNILKWDNNFSWSYNGEVADSMVEMVRKAGGSVDGVFRFTHSWNELEPNQSLMDLHVFMPDCPSHKDGCHDQYPNGRRVGWNCRKDIKSGGVQDVDYTSPAPSGYIPVENITFPNIATMPDGDYICKIHNWNFRTSGGRGKAQIAINGQIYDYVYPRTKHKEWVTIATVTLSKGQFSIKHAIEPSSSSKDIWGIKTETFVKVQSIMLSPNHWQGQAVGNKHFMFILENCKNPDTSRGMYNEFLKPSLDQHRKVFELLASKLKVPYSDEQLSGVGFSSTQRNEVICKVVGSFTRTLKIKF